MSRRTAFLFCIFLLLLASALPNAGGQELIITDVTVSPQLMTWITWGESSPDVSSLSEQISQNEENGIYDYWISFSKGSYHIQYGGIAQSFRG